MAYKVIPRFKVPHPADPTLPYMTTDGKIDECVIVTTDDALVLQNTYHIMSCQIARKEDYGLAGHVFKKTITAYRGVETNGKKSIEKEVFHVLHFLKKMGSKEIVGEVTDDYCDKANNVDQQIINTVGDLKPNLSESPEDIKETIENLAQTAINKVGVSPKLITPSQEAPKAVQPKTVAQPKAVSPILPKAVKPIAVKPIIKKP